ncbi:31524_t:CDS:2, partial [Racocetra persica]
QLVKLSDSVQSITYASTYSESNKTFQEFTTNQVYDLEIETPISTNMNDTIVKL